MENYELSKTEQGNNILKIGDNGLEAIIFPASKSQELIINKNKGIIRPMFGCILLKINGSLYRMFNRYVESTVYGELKFAKKEPEFKVYAKIAPSQIDLSMECYKEIANGIIVNLRK